jgi:hypothetical protein
MTENDGFESLLKNNKYFLRCESLFIFLQSFKVIHQRSVVIDLLLRSDQGLRNSTYIA